MAWRDSALALAAGVCGGFLTACAGPSGGRSAALASCELPACSAAAQKPEPAPAAPKPTAAPVAESNKTSPAVAAVRPPDLLPPLAKQTSTAVAGPTRNESAEPPPPMRAALDGPEEAEAKEPPPAPAKEKDTGSEKLTATLTARRASPAERPAEEPPLLRALRCYLDRHPDEAIACLKPCDKLSQELLLCVLPVAARLGEGNIERAGPEEVAVLADQLSGVEDRLRPRAALAIDRMCFCRRIETFGVYEPLPDEPAFRPGEWALVYVELRNFTCERHDAPPAAAYATRLVSSAEIRDRAGHKVWPEGPGRLVFRRKGPEESRSPWHDYFDNCSLRVPELSAGPYTLWIEVQDVPTGRSVRRSLDFRVDAVGQGRGP